MSDWVRDFYATLDSVDLDAFLARFTDDAVLVMANQPPAVGKGQMAEALGGLFPALAGLHHEFRAQVTVPAMDALDRDPDGRITGMRVAVDLAPLFARLAPA
jgi:ketosteroid isomerase-like protein